MAHMSTCTPWLKPYVLRALSPTTTTVSSLDGSYLQVISTVGGRRQVVVYDGAHTAAAVLSHAAATRLDADEDDLGVTTRNLVGHLVAPVAAVVVPDASTTPPTATLVLQDVRVFADQVAQRPPGKLPAVDRDPDVLDCLRASVGRKLAAFATRSSFVREMEEVEGAGAVGFDGLDGAFEDVLDNRALPPAGLLDGLRELGGLGVDAGAGAGAGAGEGDGEGRVGEEATEPQGKAGPAADPGAGEASEGSVRDKDDDGDEMPELQMHAVLGMENGDGGSGAGGEGGEEGGSEGGAGPGNRGDKEVREEAEEAAEEAAGEGKEAETEDFGDWEIRFSSQEQAEVEAEAEAEVDGGGTDELSGDAMPLTQHFPIDDEAEEGEGSGGVTGGKGVGSGGCSSPPSARQGTEDGVANNNEKNGTRESPTTVDPWARAAASAVAAADPSVTAGRGDAAAASANNAPPHRSHRARGMDSHSHAAAHVQEDMGNAAAKPVAPPPAAEGTTAAQPATEVTADTANSMTHGSGETREGDDARSRDLANHVNTDPAPEPKPQRTEGERGVAGEKGKLPVQPHGEGVAQQNGNAVPGEHVDKPTSPAEQPPAAGAMDVDLPDGADGAAQTSAQVTVTEATETVASADPGSADGAAKTVTAAQTEDKVVATEPSGENKSEREGGGDEPAGQGTAAVTVGASTTAAATVEEAQPAEKRGAKRRPPTPVENDEQHRKQLRTDAQQPLTTEKAIAKLRGEVDLLRAFRDRVDENPAAFVLNPDSFLPRLPGSGGATKERGDRGDTIAFPPPEVGKVTMDGRTPRGEEVVPQIPDSAPI